MKEIGGYFSIEYSNVEIGIHKNALKLNTGRNCFEYLLLVNNYKKVYIPYYTCAAITEPLNKLGVNYDFYYINRDLEVQQIPELKENEALVYTNYFGIKGNYCKKLSIKISNLIIDNSQALFELPLLAIDTFYTLRKFVGTADGAFLYTNNKLDLKFEVAASFDRISHLYKRKDINAEAGYKDFIINESTLSYLPIMSISPSTESFVNSYDFKKNKAIRERNFLFLHKLLENSNKLKIEIDDLNGPLCYPYYANSSDLKSLLIQKKIFVPTYWPNVLEWLPDKNCLETDYVHNMICLPIDQRYNFSDLLTISRIILSST